MGRLIRWISWDARQGSLARLAMVGGLALGSAAMFAACGGSSPLGPPTQDQVTVTPDSVLLFIGNTEQLLAQLNAGVGSTQATFTWATADPAVAKVDQTGLVTAVGKGKTIVTATTGSKQGMATVTVLDPGGSACPGVDTVQTWTGTLDVVFGDTLISGSSITQARHELNGTFTLTRDPSLPPGTTQLSFQGDLSGTASINETLTGQSGTLTNVGAAQPGPGSQLELRIDADACTWYLTGGWGVDATESGPGLSQHFSPEAVANILSAERPLGLWQQGLRITSGFPAYLGTQPPSANPIDAYYVLTALGITLFTSPDDTRGPAAVSFSASPN
jgi:Bacterial Ig-like domain (group 2)